MYATDSSWRLSLAEGETIAILPGLGQAVMESSKLASDHLLGQLNAAVGVLADLFA